MLLHFIFISFVVCTAEIGEFLIKEIQNFPTFYLLFLCLSRPLEILLSASLDACDNFSFLFVVVSLSMPQIRGSCGHLKGNYDNHFSCLNCSGCSRFNGCAVCHCWSDSTWALVRRRRLFRDRQMGKTKEAKVKKQRSSASRSSSSSRPGLEQTVARVDPPGSTSADGHDDDAASVLSLSSSGGERVRGNTQVPSSRSSHGTPGPKSPARRQTQRSTPARSQAGDLAGKYGVQAPPNDLEAPPLGPNPPPGNSTLSTLSKDRSPRSESKHPVERPGNSTLGTLLKDRSPRSESKRPVERPSSCDTGHNARLATKGSVQQSSVDRPVYSEHVPVTPGPGKPSSGPMTRTRYPVPPTTPGKPGTTTTPGSSGSPVTPGEFVTPGESVRPVHTGQKAQKEKTDQCLDQSELPVLNSPDRSVQLEHNVHEQPGNMPNLQAEHWSEYSEVFQDFTNSDSPNVRADESPERTHLLHSGHRSLGIGHTGNPLGIGHTGNRSDHEHSVTRSRSVRSDAFEQGSNRTRHHSDVSRSSRRDSNTHRETIPLRHTDPGEHSPASMIRHRLARSRSRSYDSVSPRRHSPSPSGSRGKKKKSHKKRKHSSTSSSSSRRSSSSSSRERERKRHKSKMKKNKHSKSR